LAINLAEALAIDDLTVLGVRDLTTGTVLDDLVGTDLAPEDVLGDALDLFVPDFLTDFFATDATKPFCCRVGPS
jgi:hypothetical protein